MRRSLQIEHGWVKRRFKHSGSCSLRIRLSLFQRKVLSLNTLPLSLPSPYSHSSVSVLFCTLYLSFLKWLFSSFSVIWESTHLDRVNRYEGVTVFSLTLFTLYPIHLSHLPLPSSLPFPVYPFSIYFIMERNTVHNPLRLHTVPFFLPSLSSSWFSTLMVRGDWKEIVL